MAGAITRALVLAGCLVIARSAAAGGKTSKLTIETDPPGAKVYFGAKEDGEVCTTPCTVEAPLGQLLVIVEAENRRPLFENVVVRRAAKPLKLQYKLALAIGTLIVEGGNGATIKIDDEARGTAPGHVDGIPAGAHRIVLERNGKPIYDEFLEIEAGQDASVSVPAGPAGPPVAPVAARSDVAASATTAPEPPARRAPAVRVTAAFDIGFRQFRYSQNKTPTTQRDDDEAGQLLAGPIVELWPTRLLGIDQLPGLAVYGRLELGINSQAVTIRDAATGVTMPTSLSTAWRSIEVSLHQRWAIGAAAALEVGAGYTQDRYHFTGSPAEIATVPDASYNAVRIGGRASLRFADLEPYLVLENRIVVSGGAMDRRYTLGASVNGIHGAVGAELRLGPLTVRAEGAMTRYSWTFKPETTDPGQADGGSDSIENLTVAVGYAY